MKSATSESYRIALDIVLDDANVDAAIAAFVPPLGVRQVDVATSIVQARQSQPDKPILAVLMGRQGFPEGRAELHEAGVPAYTFPESAARALSAMVRYRAWIDRPEAEPTEFDVDKGAVSQIVDDARADGRDRLNEFEALQVMEAYGIPVVKYRRVTTLDDALEAADNCGYPVVIKAVAPGLVHKSDVGAVRVDIRTEEELELAYGDLVRNLGEADIDLEAVLMQRFVSSGRETIIGMTTDPVLGPVLMFGLGGIYVEALKDVAFRIAPVSDLDAEEMLGSIRGARLLEAVRGEPAVDRAALVETIQRVSQLVMDHPAIGELDLNPFMAFAEGGMAVDARVSLAAEAPSGVAGPGEKLPLNG